MRTLNLACTGNVLEALRKAVDEYSSIAEERSKETIRFLVAEISKFREFKWFVYKKARLNYILLLTIIVVTSFIIYS